MDNILLSFDTGEEKKKVILSFVFIFASLGLAYFLLNFSLIPLIIFFIIHVIAICFLAAISESLWLIFLPLGVMWLLGLAIFNSHTALFFSLGLPLAFLFWHLRSVLNNRLTVNLTRDGTSSMFFYFLLLSFSITFMFFEPIFYHTQKIVNNYVYSDEAKEKCANNANCSTYFYPLLYSVANKNTDFTAEEKEQIANFKQQCLLDDFCQTSVLPLVESLEASKNSSFSMEAIKGQLADMSESDLLIMRLFLFLFLVPAAIFLSFVMRLFLAIAFSILKITGIFKVITKDVKKEYIV